MIAGLLGLAAALVGVYFMLYSFGLFDYLGGKENNPGAVSSDVLASRLLALNDPGKPYHLHKGEDTDFVAEWKIADSTWYSMFSKNRLSKSYRLSLLLDETRCSVRCYEELGTVEWTAGANGLSPNIHYQNSFFGGRVLFKKEYGVGYGIKNTQLLETGKIYEYKFDISEIKDPIIATVKASGWEWVPVTVKRNAVHNLPIPA